MEKKRGMEGDGERCFSDLDLFFHTRIVSSFPTIFLLFPYSSTFSAIISRPCLSLSSFYPYFLPASSYQPPTPFLPSVLCSSSFLFFFYIWNGEGMLCLSYHLCITFPIQRERERERGREKRSEKEKEDWEEGMRGAEERKGAGARQKEKITLLPGLMNMGKGRSQ